MKFLNIQKVIKKFITFSDLKNICSNKNLFFIKKQKYCIKNQLNKVLKYKFMYKNN